MSKNETILELTRFIDKLAWFIEENFYEDFGEDLNAVYYDLRAIRGSLEEETRGINK